MKTVVIGLTGKRGSGKNTVARYLAKKYNFILLDYTKHVLSPILRKKGKSITRGNLIKLAMELRKLHGEDILTKKICEKIKTGLWVVAGVRFPAEVEHFKKKFGNNFKLIAIECNSKLRYERTKSRNTKGEGELSYKEFLQCEKLPTEKIIPITIKLADFTIKNDGSFKELYEEIDKLMKNLRVHIGNLS